MRRLERSIGEREAAARHKASTRNTAAANRILEAAARGRRGRRQQIRAVLTIDMDFPVAKASQKSPLLTSPTMIGHDVQLRSGHRLRFDEDFSLDYQAHRLRGKALPQSSLLPHSATTIGPNVCSRESPIICPRGTNERTKWVYAPSAPPNFPDWNEERNRVTGLWHGRR